MVSQPGKRSAAARSTARAPLPSPLRAAKGTEAYVNLARLAKSDAGSNVRHQLRLHLPTSAGAGEATEGRKQKTYDEFFKFRLANWNEVNFGVWIDGGVVSSVHHPGWPTDGRNANALGIVVRNGALTVHKIDIWKGHSR